MYTLTKKVGVKILMSDEGFMDKSIIIDNDRHFIMIKR